MNDRHAATAALLLAALLLFGTLALAAPQGALITSASTDYGPNRTAGMRNDSRGTITTLVLDAVQQDQFWKAYVGNVTGALTLQDSNFNAIYSWELTGTVITGEVYATRSSGAVFTSVQCANSTVILAEQAFNNMTATQADNINKTFNWTLHRSFYVGATPIANSTCPSTFTYINNTVRTGLTSSSPFQEVLLQDSAQNILYVTMIENAEYGFDNRTYDFQLLVAESEVKASPTSYYFFTEIAS